MAEQVPSIGRIVHYVTTNGAHIPADICVVRFDGTLELFVKDSEREVVYFAHAVQEGTAPLTWHWPEYVPAKG